MRDTMRDSMMAVGAAAALFAAFQSWTNSSAIQTTREELTTAIVTQREELRTEIAALRGTLTTTSETVIAHVNSGLHSRTDTVRDR